MVTSKRRIQKREIVPKKSGKPTQKVKQKSNGKERSFYFSKGNRKLSSNILVWNLPRLKTCPGAGICKEFCYEIKIERLYKQVKACRERNLGFSKTREFVPEIVKYLKTRKEGIIRIHSSGDFYNKTYFLKWMEIARQLLAEKTFFVYTKSLHLLSSVPYPKNLILFQSFGSCFDYRIKVGENTARVIEDISEARLGEYICPYYKHIKTFKCGEDCSYCLKGEGQKKVVFIRH